MSEQERQKMTPSEALLFDLGHELKIKARQAAASRESALPGSPDRQFQSGRAMAFAEVISVMQQSANGLGISLTALRLDDIDPDGDVA
jgi:hypothetical protein